MSAPSRAAVPMASIRPSRIGVGELVPRAVPDGGRRPVARPAPPRLSMHRVAGRRALGWALVLALAGAAGGCDRAPEPLGASAALEPHASTGDLAGVAARASVAAATGAGGAPRIDISP